MEFDLDNDMVGAQSKRIRRMQSSKLGYKKWLIAIYLVATRSERDAQPRDLSQAWNNPKGCLVPDPANPRGVQGRPVPPTAYRGVGARHRAVRHSTGQYVNGDAHTNGIESFWASLKKGYATHHHLSRKHLARYLDEFTGRHNMRELSTTDRMASIDTRNPRCEALRFNRRKARRT